MTQNTFIRSFGRRKYRGFAKLQKMWTNVKYVTKESESESVAPTLKIKSVTENDNVLALSKISKTQEFIHDTNTNIIFNGVVETDTNKALINKEYNFRHTQVIDNNNLDDYIQKFYQIETEQILEIGFGDGSHIIKMATAHQLQRFDTNISTYSNDNNNNVAKKNYNYIGAETFLNGIVRTIIHIEENKINNLFLWQGDARLLLSKVPANFFKIVYILFPDPWPKKKHNKRRILNKNMLFMLSERLKINGQIIFATDCESYALSVIDLLSCYCNTFILQMRTLSSLSECTALNIQTKYCNKAIKDSKVIYYLKITKCGSIINNE